MATLTQPILDKSSLMHAYESNTKIKITGALITSYVELPNNELLIKSGGDVNRLKFIDKVDCDAAIVLIDSVTI